MYIYNNGCFIRVKYTESSAVIKLQMAYTRVSIKSRENIIVRASDKLRENYNCVGCFFSGKWR